MRLSRLKVLITVVAVLILGGLAIWGFIEGRGEAAREAEQERAISAPQRMSIENGESVLTLDADAQRQDGIATVTLRNASHQDELRAYGRVLDLQALTELASGYTNAKAQLEIAQAKLAASQTAFARARKLYKDQQNVSAAQLQAAEAAFRIDQAGAAAAESQLRTLAATAQQSWGPVLGQAIVDATPLLARLIARQDVLVQVTLRPGQSIAEPPANGFAQLDDGSRVPLDFVSPATKTDPRIQGSSFLFTAPTSSGLLPGMSTAALLLGGHAIEGAVVPLSAIVWERGRAWAYFRSGPKTFARRAIRTDVPAPKGGYVAQGLPDNTEVVVRGAQMLFSEELRSQIRVGD
jgi:hypothetical protein